MTAHSLARIVAQELASVGIGDERGIGAWGAPRRTTWSQTLPGFGVRHYAGQRRVYIVQSLMGGRTRTVTIGNAALFTDSEAVAVARRVLLRAQVGENPAETRKRTRAAPRFDDFLSLYWSKIAPSWKPSTRDRHEFCRRNHIDGAFPKMFIDEIERPDIVRWFVGVSDRSGPGAGNRAFEIVRALFNKAEDWGVREENTNPCTGVRQNRRRKCERFLSDAELARLGAVLNAARETHPQHATAILTLLLTGCRLGEIVNLRWSEVKGQRLLLEDSKTGPRTVWMGAEVRALLDALPRLGNRPEVFWDDVRDRPISLDYRWQQWRSEAGFPGVRIHDLRHSFASHAAGMSETLPMIGKLLGHAKIASTARYAHLDDGAVLAAAERIGSLIEQAACSRKATTRFMRDPITVGL